MNKTHELNPILAEYDLAEPDRITELKSDSVWRIDHPSGRWAIAERPVYDPGSRRVERLEAASRLMTALHEAGHPWVAAKPTREGRYITVRDESLYQVTAFADGENHIADPELIPDVGRAMGAFHRYQETSFDAGLPVHDFDDMTTNGLENRRQENLDLDTDDKPPIEAIDEAIERFRAISPALMALPSGLIHMDLSTANVLLKDGRLSAIIDFEAFYAPYVLDIGITGIYWAILSDSETSGRRVDKGRLKTLLESYAKERPLGQAEIAALKDAFVWSAIRKWSRGRDPRLERYRAYQRCLELDPDWLASCCA